MGGITMENIFKGFVAFLGGIFGFLFGGWTLTLQVLIALSIMDYVSGFAASYVEGTLKSKVGLIGIARKVFIFVTVAAAHLVDVILIENGWDTNALVMTTVVVFYAVNEILSIIENAGRIGLPVPKALQNAVEVLRNKGAEK